MPSRRHFLPQTERSHISPDILDVGQAFGLEALLTYLLPAERGLPISRPYGVLFFVIDHNLVDGGVFCIVPRHGVPPMLLCISADGRTRASAPAILSHGNIKDSVVPRSANPADPPTPSTTR